MNLVLRKPYCETDGGGERQPLPNIQDVHQSTQSPALYLKQNVETTEIPHYPSSAIVLTHCQAAGCPLRVVLADDDTSQQFGYFSLYRVTLCRAATSAWGQVRNYWVA